jgi:hypothetical protein
MLMLIDIGRWPVFLSKISTALSMPDTPRTCEDGVCQGNLSFNMMTGMALESITNDCLQQRGQKKGRRRKAWR